MQKTIIFLISLVFFNASSHAAAGVSDGFRGMLWGSAPQADMYAISDKYNMQRFIRTKEDSQVLGYKADSITYSYYRNALCRVDVSWWPQPENVLQDITAKLKNTWGKSENVVSQNTPNSTKIGLYSEEWISSSSKTTGLINAVRSANIESDGLLITITVRDKLCTSAAAADVGL